jgi:hypothetical protein
MRAGCGAITMTEFTNPTPSRSENRYIEIKPKQLAWMKPKHEIEAKRPLSNPHLHDFIVSILHHSAKDVFPIMGTIPELNNSKLFREYELEKSLQEHIINKYVTIYNPETHKYHKELAHSAKADAIWFFRSTKYENNIVFKEVVVHEVKTGHYNLLNVFENYLSEYHKATIDHTYVAIRLYIWAWKNFIDVQDFEYACSRNDRLPIENKKGCIKQLPIEYLLPIVKEKLFKLANNLEGDI